MQVFLYLLFFISFIYYTIFLNTKPGYRHSVNLRYHHFRVKFRQFKIPYMIINLIYYQQLMCNLSQEVQNCKFHLNKHNKDENICWLRFVNYSFAFFFQSYALEIYSLFTQVCQTPFKNDKLHPFYRPSTLTQFLIYAFYLNNDINSNFVINFVIRNLVVCCLAVNYCKYLIRLL